MRRARKSFIYSRQFEPGRISKLRNLSVATRTMTSNHDQEYNHLQQKGHMALPAQSRNRCARVCARALVICLISSAVLVARNVPVHFPATASSHSSLSAVSHHDQRPRFDHMGSQWSSPGEAFLFVPPAEHSSVLRLTSVIVPSFLVKGFHYNRPPPLS
jgi:hypothetical protein